MKVETLQLINWNTFRNTTKKTTITKIESITTINMTTTTMSETVSGNYMEKDSDVLRFEADLKSRKKKKRMELAFELAPEVPEEAAEAKEEFRELSYTELLERAFATLLRHDHWQPEPIRDRPDRVKLPPPIVQRVGSKKTAWLNFKQTCLCLHRSQEHVMSYVLAELGTEGSQNSNEHLILKGIWKQTAIQSLLAKYCREYVQCGQTKCNSIDTLLIRDPGTRLVFVACESCSARRSVIPIKSGFHATTRTDRKTARSAAAKSTTAAAAVP
jgi:translation initiation factor 2 subunit 2